MVLLALPAGAFEEECSILYEYSDRQCDVLCTHKINLGLYTVCLTRICIFVNICRANKKKKNSIFYDSPG